LTNSEARFTINVREGLVELEGNESFVDKHLEKFEEVFKAAVKDAINRGLEQSLSLNSETLHPGLPQKSAQHADTTPAVIEQPLPQTQKSSSTKHISKPTVTIYPIPVDLKAGEGKIALREFYTEKNPGNHYEKTAVFVYYLSKFNSKQEARFGEILSCYEEVNEKKPSIADIVKNSIRYKGWLEQGSEKYSARLTISGENFVKFDLPGQNGKAKEQRRQEHLLPTTDN
jgi:hypothetical protein